MLTPETTIVRMNDRIKILFSFILIPQLFLHANKLMQYKTDEKHIVKKAKNIIIAFFPLVLFPKLSILSNKDTAPFTIA